MDSYLLTWNQKLSAWNTLKADAKKTAQGKTVKETWSCGATKRIKKGNRLFLLKQGAHPKGIMAIGTATSSVYEKPHWIEAKANLGKTANYVDSRWDTILDPNQEALLPTEGCYVDGAKAVKWALRLVVFQSHLKSPKRWSNCGFNISRT